MSATMLLAVGLMGGLGAVSRFMLDAAVAGRTRRSFPFGTLAVNISGALLLGVLVGAAVSTDTARLLGVGLLGAYTTFSTWMLESHRLGEEGELRLGVGNFVVSLVLGVTAAWLGRKLGMAL